jgi:hypothetical protein
LQLSSLLLVSFFIFLFFYFLIFLFLWENNGDKFWMFFSHQLIYSCSSCQITHCRKIQSYFC